MAICKYCEFCKQHGRQKSNRWTFGRKHYWCEHPSIETFNSSVFGNKSRGFIDFGENNLESKLALKTTPRWCPFKQK